MVSRIQLHDEEQLLYAEPPPNYPGTRRCLRFWKQLNYPSQHLILLALVSGLFLIPVLFADVFHLKNATLYSLTLAHWSLLFSTLTFTYIASSLFVRLVIDFMCLFRSDKSSYYARFLYRVRRLVVLFSFFFISVIIFDRFLPSHCSHLPVYDPNDPSEPYPVPEGCKIHFIRQILLCTITTMLGLILVKWCVMTISLKYQDSVYRDRIIWNRYQLHVANALFEGCREEGAKHGLDLTGFSSTSVDSTTTSGSDTSDENPFPALVPAGPVHRQPPTFLSRLAGIFTKKSNRPTTHPQGTAASSGHVHVFPLLNFNSFKRTVKVFRSDFTLFESEHDDLGPTEAKKRAASVFRVLQSSSSHGRDYITMQDFLRIFKARASASEAYSIFDVNFDGQISKSELKQTFVHIYREHSYLAQSVLSSAEALRALDTILQSVTFVILSLIYMIIFGLEVQNLLTLSLSVVLAFNVFIGNFSKDLFDSLIFLFVTHPFDIGDRIKIEGDPKFYLVKQINVLRTEFQDAKGEAIYIPNPILVHKNITNLRRSKEQWESIELFLDMSTTEGQLNEFRSNLTTFLQGNPQYFYPKFDMESLGHPGHLDVYPARVRIQCKPTADNMRRAERHREILAHVKGELENLGISYYPKGPDGPRTAVTPPLRPKSMSMSSSSGSNAGSSQPPKIEPSPPLQP